MATKKSPHLKHIGSIIKDHFDPTPAEKAAEVLHDLGIHSDQINMKEICHKRPWPSEPQVLAVINALRDIEREHTMKFQACDDTTEEETA